MASRQKLECDNMAPIWRRSLTECEMRSPTTRFEVGVVVAFLIVLAAALVYFLPGFLGFS
jgi:hypothetical protein